jgi:hypothetical protein
VIVARLPFSRRVPSSRRSRHPASAQETTLDLLWISEGVVCFAGGRAGGLLYRALLALEGPAHTPRALASADSGALAGYRALLNGLDCPVQVVVHPQPLDTSTYAARWERRASELPAALAALAREHALWARVGLAGLRLVHRRAFMVVPADDDPAATERARGEGVAGRVRHGFLRAPERTVVARTARAHQVLEERCARLGSALGAAGVAATRLDDVALAQLYRICWNPSATGASRAGQAPASKLGRRS